MMKRSPNRSACLCMTLQVIPTVELNTRDSIFPLRDTLSRLTLLLALSLVGADAGRAQAQAPPLLEVAPGRVTFITSEGNQATQRVRVRNAGGGQLAWRARANTPWISVTPQSGVAPAELVVTVDATSLSAGNYSGRVTIEAGRNAGSPAFVDVVLSLAAPRPPGPPTLRATPAKVLLSKVTPGQTQRVSAIVKLEADREAAVKWAAKSDRPWLTVAPAEGSTPLELRIEAIPEGLAAGQHEASVSILAPDGKPVLRVPVIIQVGATPGVLSLVGTSLPPATLNLPYSQAVPVRGGQPPYRVQLDTGPMPPDLALANGAISGIARVPGTYTLGLTVTDSSAPPNTVTQKMTLPVIILDRNTALIIEPPSVALTATAPKLSTDVTIAVMSGSQALPWRASSDAAWLRVSPAEGTAPTNVTISADAKSLPAGVYVATLTVSMDGAPNSPARIPVQLTVRK